MLVGTHKWAEAIITEFADTAGHTLTLEDGNVRPLTTGMAVTPKMHKSSASNHCAKGSVPVFRGPSRLVGRFSIACHPNTSKPTPHEGMCHNRAGTHA